MFGLQKRREARRRASERPSVLEAVREVLAQHGLTTLYVGDSRVSGYDGTCSVSFGIGSMDLADAWRGSLQEALGSGYTYSLYLRGIRTTRGLSQRLAPGWRSYAALTMDVRPSFKNFREYQRWLGTSEGRNTHVLRYGVSIRSGR